MMLTLEQLTGRRRQKETADLARLLAITPEAAGDHSPANLVSLLGLTAKALLVEQKRREQATWFYDVNRHLNLADTADKLMQALALRAGELSLEQVNTVSSLINSVKI